MTRRYKVNISNVCDNDVNTFTCVTFIKFRQG
ncbi:Uncharacterised protein [Enterobacter cancerogenus]|uniref:Uncharacterized protein n=1 Tax=Enterobacter cancerogenus TaxID=69218 RepID=A0A484XQC7_9ENTR|nr:Uncharacterised protein [Enterobacter cancerogenus]